ncbi:MAG: hypothetical protein LW875_08080 [Proteobacteria bacterium]|nr:hypothetical protein [Pseudomonadota bacterium]
MGTNRIMVLFIACLLGALAQAQSQRPILLITSFEDFDIVEGPLPPSAARNMSNLLGAQLSATLKSKLSDKIRVEHLVLPVSFARAHLELFNFIHTLPQQPHWIISLGVSNRKYQRTIFDSAGRILDIQPIEPIQLEVMARNTGSTISFDNDGFTFVSPKGEKSVPLDPSQPDLLPFNTNPIEILCEMQDQRSIVISSHPGDYVCNSLAFRVTEQIRANKLVSAFQFIHIPNFTPTGSGLKNMRGETQDKFFARNLKLLENYVKVFIKLGHKPAYLPTADTSAIANHLQRFEQRKAISEKSQCLYDAYTNLLKSLKHPALEGI